jgi:hypothetical protein
VNAAGPGNVKTTHGTNAGLSREESDAYFKRTALNTQLGRNGQADDIEAPRALFAADDSAFVTGIEMLMDGGYAV